MMRRKEGRGERDRERREALSSGLQATVILDMATLTGAAADMTGKHHAALLTNSPEYEDRVGFQIFLA